MSDSTDEDRWSLLAADLGVDGSTPAKPASEPDGETLPKRRRRRRSRKPGASDGSIGGTVQPSEAGDEGREMPEASGDTPSAPDGEPKKRRRHRSRRTAAEGSGELVGGADAVAIATVDDDDDAAEPVSVANLPSWQELIDGLHRP